MSFGIVRVQKMTKGSVRGIEIHDLRIKNGVSHTNREINWNKTHLNYNLFEQKNSFYNAVNNRISELKLKKSVRKDAIVMSQILVTSDSYFFKNLSMQEQEQFFKDSYNFLIKKYGQNNVISATVHLDEKTPHLHFNFVPITEDNRLSAKSLFTPTTLRQLQDDFYNEVGKNYNLERGLKGSKTKHLEVAQYKTRKEKEKIVDLQDDIEICNKELETKQEIIKIFDERNIFIEEDVKKKKYFNQDKVKNYIVPAEKYEKMYYQAEMSKSLNSLSETIKADLSDFKEYNETNQVKALKAKLGQLESKIYQLEVENRELSYGLKTIEQNVNKNLELLPDEVSQQFIKSWNENFQLKRGFGRTR